MRPKVWSDICKGVHCDKKDECRRYTYHMLAVLRNRDIGAFLNRCDEAKLNGADNSFISNDSEGWRRAPSWWTE